MLFQEKEDNFRIVSPDINTLFSRLQDLSNYVSQVGRPYLWAQRMGGLQFLDGGPIHAPKTALSAQTIQSTVKKLRQRIQSRLALLKQLGSLGK